MTSPPLAKLKPLLPMPESVDAIDGDELKLLLSQLWPSDASGLFDPVSRPVLNMPELPMVVPLPDDPGVLPLPPPRAAAMVLIPFAMSVPVLNMLVRLYWPAFPAAAPVLDAAGDWADVAAGTQV